MLKKPKRKKCVLLETAESKNRGRRSIKVWEDVLNLVYIKGFCLYGTNIVTQIQIRATSILSNLFDIQNIHNIYDWSNNCEVYIN